MRKIILATGTDQGYTYEPYLFRMNLYSQVTNYCVCVDFWPHPNTRNNYPNINFRLLRWDQIDTDVPVNCVQNGDFLKVIDAADDDIIIFTDSDMRLQRPFNEQEIEWLLSFKYGEVSAQYNAGPHDTLLWDTHLIGTRDNEYVLRELLEGGKYANEIAYNVGVVVATYGTYKEWHRLYVKEWPRVADAFTHQARQQWLMTLILAKGKLPVWLSRGRDIPVQPLGDIPFTVLRMPYTFHVHGCFPLPDGCGFDTNNRLLYRGDIVLFRHNVRGQGW